MKRAPERPDVEPLSELAWHRIEKNLFARLELDEALPETRRIEVTPPRRRAWPVAAGLGLAAAAAVALLFALPRDAGVALPTSRIVTTDAASEVSVGDADLVVEPESAILVSSQSDRVEVILERGSVDCKVAPRVDRPPFVVRAGRVRVEVIGTEFSVTRAGDSAEVEVREGLVKVIANGELARVGPGERWPPEVAVADDGDRADELDAAADRRRERARRRRAAERRDARARQRREEARARQRRDSDQAQAQAEPSPRERYERAAGLERSDPAAAIETYRELSREGGPWAANALFAQARLELEREREEVAARLLRRYLRRYPEGANAGDARSLLRDLEAP